MPRIAEHHFSRGHPHYGTTVAVGPSTTTLQLYTNFNRASSVSTAPGWQVSSRPLVTDGTGQVRKLARDLIAAPYPITTRSTLTLTFWMASAVCARIKGAEPAAPCDGTEEKVGG